MELAALHRVTAPDASVAVRVLAGSQIEAIDLLVGGGFTVDRIEVDAPETGVAFVVHATRAHSLADTVGHHLRVLFVGLNPSEYAADAGVGYARPGNRFWPAILQAGLVTRDRDALHAYTAHGIGLTDLVKRATPRSSDVTRAEYEEGARRVERLVQRERPGVVAFVGLEGYRIAVDRAARTGWQSRRFGGAPTYVLPSTSGLNAHAQLPDFIAHFREVYAKSSPAAS